MVKSTVREESEYRFPDDVQYSGKLLAVEEQTINFTYKESSAAVKSGRARAGEAGSFKKWRWTFAVVGGEFDGEKITTDTNAGITNRADDKARQFAETLLGRELGIGEDFDSDSIVGLPCTFTVKHDEPVEKKNGETGYYCSVDDVFPAGSAYDEPPF